VKAPAESIAGSIFTENTSDISRKYPVNSAIAEPCKPSINELFQQV